MASNTAGRADTSSWGNRAMSVSVAGAAPDVRNLDSEASRILQDEEVWAARERGEGPATSVGIQRRGAALLWVVLGAALFLLAVAVALGTRSQFFPDTGDSRTFETLGCGALGAVLMAFGLLVYARASRSRVR
jgi:hypothetical protein